MTVEEHRRLIIEYLKKHGPAGAPDIERGVGLSKGKVWHALKGSQFRRCGINNCYWGLTDNA